MAFEKVVIKQGALPVYFGLSTDTKPSATSVPKGTRLWEADTDLTYVASPEGWTISMLARSPLEVPRLAVVPTIASTPAGKLKVDSVSGTIQCVGCVVNPGSDANAGSYLANGTGGSDVLFPGDDFPILSDQDITDIYLMVFADGGTDAGSNNIVDSSVVQNANGQYATTVGAVATFDATSAELLAATNIVHLEFDAADKVRHARIRLGRTFDTDTQMYISVKGFSYA